MGTYGELLTTEYISNDSKTTDILRTKFLYNGQLGVVTDDNGLYYMRSRYYNPEIKRFINQDILTGNIGNSASLNRYSYVEGNPVSYTDPFGLSPFSYFTDKIKPNISVHTVLDALGCIPGPVGTFFDLTNAGLYFTEGDWKSGAESIIFAIPGMDLGGKGTKFIMKGTKAGRIVGNALKGIDFFGNVAAACITADRLGNNVAGMIDKYMVNGEEVSWDTVGETGGLLVSCLMVRHYSKGAVNSAKGLEFNPKDYAGKVVDESLIDNIAYKKVPSYDELPGGTYIISSSGKGGIIYCVNGVQCFTAGTKIRTSDGEKNIEDIQVGDEVYACDVETGEIGLKKVKQTFVHDETEIVHVTIAGETIDTTAEHPFYVEGYGFKLAGELQSGDKVVLLDGTTAEVETVEFEHLEEPVKVYNFEVEDWHTYYVSDIGV
ncbi:MAG: Hint domain-containing protein, partial [Lachnospiraceae bacterium]|nr:Hint domain-containing protein [Lachnospiraceae bacterium]